MAKTSAVQRNLKRIKLVKKFQKKREMLKKIINNKKLPLEERFAAQLKLAKIPRNSAKIRIRCRKIGPKQNDDKISRKVQFSTSARKKNGQKMYQKVTLSVIKSSQKNHDFS